MPSHGDGDEFLSFSPSINPHYSTQDLPKTPAAQIPPNTYMELETLDHSFSAFDDDFRSFSWTPPEPPQIDLPEIISFAAAADAPEPEDRRPWSTDADILGVNDGAAPQAAPPVPVAVEGGHAALCCATAGTTEIQQLEEEEDAQRRLYSWNLSDVEQCFYGEPDPLAAPDENLVEGPAPATEDGRPSGRDAEMAEVSAAATQPATLDELRQITNNFSDDQLFGEGAFGKVYEGVLTNGDMIAVKRFASTITGLQDVQYENEAQHLMRLKHPNIVQPVGYCSETAMKRVQHNGTLVHAEKSQRLLCAEYMSNGSLVRHHSDETSGLDWNTRDKIIKGIRYGLEAIIHMDLKPANILLDDNMVPKIADFALSRLFREEQTQTCTTSCKGTPGYMAPEYFEKRTITCKADIYSLGVIIVEIITGHKYYPTDETETGSQQYIDLVLDNWRHRPTKAQRYTSQDIDYQQIEKCIQIGRLSVEFDPVKRPTIKQIIKMLERSDEAYRNEREEEAQRWFDSWKSTVLQDLSPEVQPDAHGRTSFQKFNLEELRYRLSSWERMNSIDFQNGELLDSKGVSIVSFAGPDPKGRKPQQGRRWKEKSIMGMRAVADPSPQLPAPGQQQQRYVGFKKTLELDGDGDKWRAHEYTPLLPSDDDSNQLVPADISLRVEFKEDEPLSSSSSSRKRSRSGAPKDGPKAPVKSPVWEHMTRVRVKADGSQRKKPRYKVMYAICHRCDKVLNADSGNGTNNLSKHLDSCSCNCTCTHSHYRSSLTFRR